jgi:hypothetical protein
MRFFRETIRTFVIRGKLHGGERIQVFAALGEKIVPTSARGIRFRILETVHNEPDKTALCLVVNQIQGIVRPGFLNLLNVFFEGHLSTQ